MQSMFANQVCKRLGYEIWAIVYNEVCCRGSWIKQPKISIEYTYFHQLVTSQNVVVFIIHFNVFSLFRKETPSLCCCRNSLHIIKKLKRLAYSFYTLFIQYTLQNLPWRVLFGCSALGWLLICGFLVTKSVRNMVNIA